MKTSIEIHKSLNGYWYAESDMNPGRIAKGKTVRECFKQIFDFVLEEVK